jgi:tetratricopeptide (TPR) repeat protein
MRYDSDPEQLAKEGQRAYTRKEFRKAAQAFHAAASLYAEIGNNLAAAEQLNNASVAYLQSGDPSLALRTAAGTEETFAAADDIQRQAISLGNQAAALEALGELEDSVSLYEKSAELLKQCGDNELRVSVMQSLSAVQLRLGRQLEALASMQAGLENIPNPSIKQRLVKKILRAPLDFLGRSS